MSISPSHCAIVSCDVFEDELQLFGKSRNWRSIQFLAMGLHDRPDILRQSVQDTVDRLEQDPGIETILLLYGICGQGLIGISSARCRLVLPRAHDCISIMLGSPDVHQDLLKENPGTYFYTPGWIRGKRVPGPDRDAYIKDYYSRKYPGDQEMVDDLLEADKESFGHYNCAAFVDMTGNLSAERYCKQCAASSGWQYRSLQADQSLIVDFLDGNWDQKRFSVVEPGSRITNVLDHGIDGIQG